MADASTQDSGVTSLLAPWMAQNPWDPSNYGGMGQFGAAMLAGAGPTPYKMPFLVGLGKAMQAGQQNALQNAGNRMNLATNSLSLQQRMAMMPFLMRTLARLQGQRGADPNVTGLQAAPNASAGAVASNAAQATGQSGASPASPQQPSAAPWMAGQQAPQQQPQQSQQPQSDDGGDIDPMEESRLGATLSAVGMKNDFGADAQRRLEFDPGMQSQLALAKDPTTLDLLQYTRALEMSHGQPNPMAQAYLNKFKTDTGMQHIGSMSGIFTQVEPDGSVTTYNPSTGLRVNSRTGAQYMPGALNAFAAREAAEASARTRAGLQAETAPAGSGGSGDSGSGAPPTATPSATAARRTAAAPAPAPAALQGAAAFNEPNYVPDILARAGNVRQAPGSTSLVALKAGQEAQAEAANKWVEEQNDKAEAGQTLMAQQAQIRAAATEYPWTGRFADDRASYLSALQGVGWISPQQAKELSSYQDASKISIQLQASATRQLGSREAAQVFGTMGKSIPNLTMSPDGLDKVSAYNEGIARYNQAMAQYGQRLMAAGNVAGVNQVENTFVAHSNPSFFIMASASPKSRNEFLASMPPAKRNAFLRSWDSAIKNGLAPRPLDYQQLGQ